MIEAEILKEKIRVLGEDIRKLRGRRAVILSYAMGSGLFLWLSYHPEGLPRQLMTTMIPIFIVWLLAMGALVWWITRRRVRAVDMARLLEAHDPKLQGLALTAVELLAKPELSYLDHRVIAEFTDYSATHDWKQMILGWRVKVWAAPLLIFTCLLFVMSFRSADDALAQLNREASQAVVPAMPANPAAVDLSATIRPGDTEIERGSRLIVEATFAKEVPDEATLVVADIRGKERERIPLRLTVDGQVFGGMIARVDEDSLYHVEFAGGRSQQHRITTFVYPKLERVDVKITPPAYTQLPVREIANTMKITAMEGSAVEFKLKINKAVREAELFGEDKTVLKLAADLQDPTTLTGSLMATKGQKWRVHLVDEHERANQNPPWITVNVTANQLAKIEVMFPKRDVQVSPIQELPVEARVWDDLGVIQSGASFSMAGKTREVIFKHGLTAPSQKQEVRELLTLETEQAKPRQLVSYHFWAEDTGPQGEVRRAMSDMFFAEVRHFEDIFREGDSPPGEGKEPKTSSDQLVELQKQIVNATWRLVRDSQAGRSMEAAASDANVVRESQQTALDQTKEAMEKVEDATIKGALTEAWKSMKDALGPLEQAASEKKRTPLNQALTFEQSALEWLHQAQSREHQITRSKSKKAASGKQKAMQNQLMNLELKQEEQRYEEEKQATEEQTAEQQENLQVLNRLKELARRQEALAAKMKEWQNQMAQAKTEQEKQDLESQLQRLEEEQEQLLRDVDDLQERMEKPENADTMAEARQQLEETRRQVGETAEKLKQQNLTDAANAATRAQRQLEKMQEDFKQKTAKRFGDEMKQMRQQAREVAEKQKQINEALENQKTPESARGDSSADLEKMIQGGEVSRQIQEQQDKVSTMLEDMQRLSEQAEGNNPLLHRRLYETVREAKTGGLEEHLDEARMQSRYGERAAAQEAERQASTLVEKLQQGVEKAAESVLGSEAEALRLARAELDQLIQEARQESPGENAPASQANDSADQAQTNPAQSLSSIKDPGSPQGSADPQAQAAGESKAPGTTPAPTKNGSPTPSASASPRGQERGGAGDSAAGGQETAGLFFEQSTERPNGRPLTGEGYGQWTDRLRNVEELLNQPELRNEAARVLDNARAMRIDHERNDAAPQVDHLQMRILTPLVELRDRVAEELARRNTQNPTVPVDRDPVPPVFRDLVKRYYQELGNGN